MNWIDCLNFPTFDDFGDFELILNDFFDCFKSCYMKRFGELKGFLYHSNACTLPP